MVERSMLIVYLYYIMHLEGYKAKDQIIMFNDINVDTFGDIDHEIICI